MRHVTDTEAKAVRDVGQFNLLDEILRDLVMVYKHKIGRIRSTEYVDLARGDLYTCIKNLQEERNFRAKNAQKAAEQLGQIDYQRRLSGQGGEYIDVDPVEGDIDV